jgi:hypothetical protein
MKITVGALRKIISEEYEYFMPDREERIRSIDPSKDVFVAPPGFSELKNLKSLKMIVQNTAAKRGVFDIDNGNIVVITDRTPYVWIASDNKNRTVPFEQALAGAKKAGYKKVKGKIHVPSSVE